MNQKIIGILILLMAVVVLVFSQFGNGAKVRALKKEMLALEDGSVMTLEEVIPFEWERLFQFDPYTPREQIEKAIRKKIHRSSLTVNDHERTMLAMNGKDVVYDSSGDPAVYGYLFQTSGEMKRGEHTEFRVEHRGDYVFLVQMDSERVSHSQQDDVTNE